MELKAGSKASSSDQADSMDLGFA